MGIKKNRRNKAATPQVGPVAEQWHWFAGGRLKGCQLLRECQRVLVWDDTQTVYMLDVKGQVHKQWRAPMEIQTVRGGDTGRLIVILSRQGDLWFLNDEFEQEYSQALVEQTLGLGVDPHGNYILVSPYNGHNRILDRYGKIISEFETIQALRHIQFAPTQDSILAASEQGTLWCFNLQGGMEWKASLLSNISDLTIDGYGEAVLVCCLNQGIVRFNESGEREGTYRVEGTPNQIALNFSGTRFWATTLEQHLTELTYGGQVQASAPINGKAVSLNIDALGRYGIVGYETGEVHFFQFPAFFAEPTEAKAAPKVVNVRNVLNPNAPDWETKAAKNMDEVASAVLDIVSVPDTIEVPAAQRHQFALYTNTRTLRLYDLEGDKIHESPGIIGVGRILRVAPGWILAASDTAICAYDAVRQQSMLWEPGVLELSHLQPWPAFGAAVTVEACTAVTRVQFPDKELWVYKSENSVEFAAVLPNYWVCLALDNRSLLVLDEKGKKAGRWRFKPAEPLQVVGLESIWISTSRESRLIRGHEVDGTVRWTQELPWRPWRLSPLGNCAVVNNELGAVLVINEEGDFIAENEEPRDNAKVFFYQDDQIARIMPVSDTLIASTLDGDLFWRYQADQTPGPFTANSAGAWAFLGRNLAFFSFAVK